MKVSVIIPARNAAGTIAETFQSLQAQTFTDWEAIVIDDGSTDATAEITQRHAAADPRIRMIVGDAQGVSVARNRGLAEARHEWILFLDADDWIKPSHLQTMTAAIRKDPELAGAYCGYARVAEDGTEFAGQTWWEPVDLFEQFARCCIWTVHATVVRKSVILEVGGFLPGWKTCEDWDLWLRIARTGARFAMVCENLALYRMRHGSASLDAEDMVRGSLETVRLGHSPDPRVPNPKPEYANGLPAEGLTRARLTVIAWSAALLIGDGQDGRQALKAVAGERDPGLDPGKIAWSLYEGVILPHCRTTDAWIELLPVHSRQINDFLEALEELSDAPYLARRARLFLEQLIIDGVGTAAAGSIGATQVVTVEVTEPIQDLHIDGEAGRVSCQVLMEGQPIGSLHLPVCDGVVPAAVLADRIASEFPWNLLERHLDESVYGELASSRTPTAWIGRKVTLSLGRLFPRRRKDFESWALASIHWVAFLKELFATETAPALQASGEPVVVEISEPIPDVSTSEAQLRVALTFGGVPIGALNLDVHRQRVSAATIRREITAACGFELVHLAVREVLVGRPVDASRSIRDSLQRNARRAREANAALDTGAGAATLYHLNGTSALLLGRVPDSLIGTCASRRATLPSAVVRESLEAFPTYRTDATADPARAIYAPEFLAAPAAHPGSAPWPRPAVSAAPRARQAWDVVSRLVERASPAIRRAPRYRAIADRLPIVMYHRIADDGPADLTSWRVSPEQFEAQMAHLHERGYYSVTLDQWRAARGRQRQLRGRPILITFDDGYQDFADAAWPILKKYGFSAIVFLVSGQVGGTNAWDRAYGHEVPLMDWDCIRRLRDEGVQFGSHTVTHPPLAALRPEEIAREALQSRTVLQRELDRPVRTIAYPYGDYDPAVRHLFGGCGYVYGLTCRTDVARYYDPLMDLPRINVEPGYSLEALTQRLELRHADAAHA